MPSDYRAIKKENIGSYGTKVGNYGKIFFEDIYSEKNHFIFELLQNAEDALARRQDPKISGAVRFDLRKDCLLVSHFGAPFTEQDVRGICAIAESTKDVNDIGRFGIGFKSVYAYTDRPEVHSGSEDFVIENFVWPEAADPIDRDPESTVFRFPLKDGGESSYGEISSGLVKLGPDALLFLRHIDEIIWTDENGRSGHYLRSQEPMADSVRRVTLKGGAPPFETEEYMVFTRPAKRDDGGKAGFVEIAFLLSDDRKAVRRVATSNLVAFFPTVVRTGLGFLVQGPYRTTPTRETVPPADPWNQHLVRETAKVLVEALNWFRDHELLDIEVLECLPLEKKGRFEPLFDTTREALTSQAMLPRADGGYIAGEEALLARGQGIRDLLDPERLEQVFPGKRAWVSEQITPDRTPRLHAYLRNVVSIATILPASIVRRLDRSFLEEQPDEWIIGLYEYLDTQRRIGKETITSSYLIRLSDNTHCTAQQEPPVFLPASIQTECSTVKETVCESSEARSFLEHLGLTEVSLVDDFVQNILPIYENTRLNPVRTVLDRYNDDIQRLLYVYKIANREQRTLLISRVKKVPFILTMNNKGERLFRLPKQVYWPTERLIAIFNGVATFVDDICIQTDDDDVLRKVLQASGVAVNLRPRVAESITSMSRGSLRQMKVVLHESNRKEERLIDWDVQGIQERIQNLHHIPVIDRQQFGKAVWKELLNAKRDELKSSKVWDPYNMVWRTTFLGSPPKPIKSKSLLYGSYETSYYRKVYTSKFPSALVRLLNKSQWVSDASGDLHRPSDIEFGGLGWESDPELCSLIEFKRLEPEERDLEFGRAKHVNKKHLFRRLANESGMDVSYLREGVELLIWLRQDGISLDDAKERLERRRSSSAKERRSDTEFTADDNPSTNETVSYREALGKVMTSSNGDAGVKHVNFPEGGPMTKESAAKDTERSASYGRSGSKRTRTSVSFIKSQDARKLEKKFREMAGGDYDGRCQVCGTAFLRPDGESSRFITHIVDPARHRMSNHYGNLLSLCGLHHALIKWGRWSAIDADGALVTSFLKAASEKVDDSGIAYIGVRVLFMGLYPAWQPTSQDRDEVIRFSKPHWEYHRTLFETEEK